MWEPIKVNHSDTKPVAKGALIQILTGVLLLQATIAPQQQQQQQLQPQCLLPLLKPRLPVQVSSAVFLNPRKVPHFNTRHTRHIMYLCVANHYVRAKLTRFWCVGPVWKFYTVIYEDVHLFTQQPSGRTVMPRKSRRATHTFLNSRSEQILNA